MEIKMPRIGDKMKKGIVCAWLKEEGESFSKGEVLFEIEADKVVKQVEAEADGTLKKILVDEGDEAECDTAVAIVE